MRELTKVGVLASGTQGVLDAQLIEPSDVGHKASSEADLDALPGDADLQEELDLDSMDFLNFLIAVSELTGVEIPESDSSQVRTFVDCANYVKARVASTQ